ncbi:MAG: serine/threonine-protein kinase [Verrucomicrobiota bacterium]|jgi:serine/threonine protein kinase
MDTIRICAQCHAPLAADVTGSLCPNCQRAPTGLASVPPALAAAPFSPPTAAQIAEFFPQLEVFELLGCGGMGMVYKARQLNLDRMVALKILSPELSSQPAFAERFSREAKALARLHHSNIVAVYDFGRAGPYYYFLMEYVDGVDLHSLIQRKELKPPEALRIVVEICQALQFAHDEGIVHRDIKPANILLDKKGRVKMADFGLAKLAGTGGQRLPALTVTTGLMGTPQYMAPEQIERPSEVDHRADLYSLGVIFYEMLTGELPLGRFPLPSQKAHTDVRLDQVVMRALEKEPDRRYQQASEILTQVETLSAPATAAVRSRKIAVVYQVGMVCALVLVAVLAYGLFHSLAHPKIITNTVTITNSPPGFPGIFTNTPEGRSFSPALVSELQLNPDQLQVANTIIRTTYRDYLQIERLHARRTKDAAGHVHVTITPLSEEDVAQVQKLGGQLWRELDGVLTPAQQETAHNRRIERALLPLNTNQTDTVEIWKDKDGEYHFIDTSQSPRRGGISRTSSSTNIIVIPSRYRPYLNDNP